MKATKLDFLTALKQAVMFSPQNEMKCRQLQTFRVLEKGGGALLSASNFGATICDKDKPFFWSRAWHDRKYAANKIEFEFPALAVVETAFTIDNPLAAQQTRCYEFNISVMDKYTADCEKMKCSGCNGRTINEIFEDTETLLFSALNYLGGVIGATVQPGGDGFFHQGLLDAWKNAGRITDYIPGKAWGGKLAQNIQNATAYKASLQQEGLFGTSITITVCFDYCDNSEYAFSDFDSLGITNSAAGCQNCG